MGVARSHTRRDSTGQMGRCEEVGSRLNVTGEKDGTLRTGAHEFLSRWLVMSEGICSEGKCLHVYRTVPLLRYCMLQLRVVARSLTWAATGAVDGEIQ